MHHKLIKNISLFHSTGINSADIKKLIPATLDCSGQQPQKSLLIINLLNNFFAWMDAISSLSASLPVLLFHTNLFKCTHTYMSMYIQRALSFTPQGAESLESAAVSLPKPLYACCVLLSLFLSHALPPSVYLSPFHIISVQFSDILIEKIFLNISESET